MRFLCGRGDATAHSDLAGVERELVLEAVEDEAKRGEGKGGCDARASQDERLERRREVIHRTARGSGHALEGEALKTTLPTSLRTKSRRHRSPPLISELNQRRRYFCAVPCPTTLKLLNNRSGLDVKSFILQYFPPELVITVQLCCLLYTSPSPRDS